MLGARRPPGPAPSSSPTSRPRRGCKPARGLRSSSVVARSSATPPDVSGGTSITRPADWSSLRRPTSSKPPSGSPPNERRPLSSERCARRRARAPSCVRAQLSSGRPPVKRGLRRSSRHTPSCMRRRGGSAKVRCCRAPSRADSTPSPFRSGRSGRRASLRSASPGTSCGSGSTSCGERSGRPGRRTRAGGARGVDRAHAIVLTPVMRALGSRSRRCAVTRWPNAAGLDRCVTRLDCTPCWVPSRPRCCTGCCRSRRSRRRPERDPRSRSPWPCC